MPRHTDKATAFAREWGFDGVIFDGIRENREIYTAAVRSASGTMSGLYDSRPHCIIATDDGVSWRTPKDATRP